MMQCCARMLLFVVLLLAGVPAAAAPELEVPDEPVGVAGAGLPVNFLLNFAVTVEDLGAAYREPYQAQRRYDGYFNPGLCYSYPMKQGGAMPKPDLDERNGYFSPAGAADARHECASTFSGNFLNWASMSTLDLLRSGLSGGDRVIDGAGITVLQRAWLPDDSARLFPTKGIEAGPDGSAPARLTPFAGARLFVVSCGNRLRFGSSALQCGASGAVHGSPAEEFLGEFNARVQVCTADDAASRPLLCAPFDEGFKPQGALQAARQPVGVMGYLTELQGLGNAEYGGALRAPLKPLAPVVGARQTGQRKAEWDASSGVLADDPDSAGGLSGAINYINRLGRANPKRPGAYSRGDPGAELYYEALRYLQGRPASIAPGAVLDDGLPLWRMPPDPILQGCQRNIVATIGHGAFARDRFVPGNTITSSGDAARAPDAFVPDAPFDVMAATRRVGTMESASGGDAARLDTQSAGSGGSYYLAGAAWWAHTQAIRADKPVRVDSVALELGGPARAGRSVLYYAAKYGGFADRNGDADPNITTGQGTSEWASRNGEPIHYYQAAGPDEIIPAVQALLGDAAGGGEVRGASAVGGVGADRYLIQAGYRAGEWTGTLQRRDITVSANGTVDIAATPAWDAALLLSGTQEGISTGTPGNAAAKAPSPTAAERAIYTYVRKSGQAGRMLPFRWPDLPPDARAWFKIGAGPASEALAAARVDYVRGERRQETALDGAAVWRRRGGVLGDIVRSTPLIVGAPSASIGDPGYAEFYDRTRQRRSTVYVGANDGMLHAFDAASGREQFAYIPGALLPALPALTQPGYQHRPYVDASPGHGEALVLGRWRTVLAAGMGMGARGLFALDVTDPAAFASGAGVLWEFTEQDDPAIGHIHAPPRIVKLALSGKEREYRYFVVVSSGINPATKDGRGALFLLALDKPATQAWQSGVNYYKVVTPAAGGSANALSPPALALGGDGAARYGYAGDLQGKLWRFDLTGQERLGGGAGPPLFVARDGAGLAQPIAHAPALVFAPGGGYLVMFATGKFIEPADARPASFTPQGFYAVHDRLKPIDASMTRAALMPRILSGRGPYLVSGKPLSYSGELAKAGWYLDFADGGSSGERASGPALVEAGAVLFDTLLPSRSCAAPGQRSYSFDALSGMALGHDGAVQSEAVTGQTVLGDGAGAAAVFNGPLLLALGGATATPHASGSSTVTHRYAIVRPGAAANGSASIDQLKVASTARRLSWRQVANWKDLHDKARR